MRNQLDLLKLPFSYPPLDRIDELIVDYVAWMFLAATNGW